MGNGKNNNNNKVTCSIRIIMKSHAILNFTNRVNFKKFFSQLKQDKLQVTADYRVTDNYTHSLSEINYSFLTVPIRPHLFFMLARR